MTLDADIGLSLGDLELDIELHAAAGEVTAVLGPNGAGKTTLLRCLAGDIAIDRGRITLDDVVLDEPPRTFVVPERRGLGLVHQDYLLFPHLDARDNVAFGLRSTGVATAAARAQAIALLERVGVGELARSKPRALSGGQAQRVALARALAIEPRALLLDEPLAALDATTRVEVRRDLHRYLAEVDRPTILVTHDPIDALVLADRVLILEQGSVTQTGSIHEVTSRPRSRYVADLIGTNLYEGRASGLTVTVGDMSLSVADPHEGAVFLTIAPSAVALHLHEPEGSARNRWSTQVRSLDLLGDRVRVRLGLAGSAELVAEITPRSAEEMALREGSEVWASVKATEVTVYPS